MQSHGGLQSVPAPAIDGCNIFCQGAQNAKTSVKKSSLYGSWDVIVFVPSKEEDSDRITCGNALISNSKEV